MKDEFIIKCPVCGEEIELFDICDNCNYQNNGLNESLDETLGANKMILREAKEAYKKGKKII